MTKQAGRTDYTQPATQQVEVFGSEQAKDILTYNSPAFVRDWRTRPVSFTCMGCGQTITQERFPGPTPRYCSPGCQARATEERRREQTPARGRRYRERHKPMEDPSPPA